MIYQLLADAATSFIVGLLIGYVLYSIYILIDFVREWRKLR